ncbi:MAG: hypothetical protein L6V93_17645 [Clostridiales bacterium]|nr:MAG: hypothetical protein L6V93_17645 [Clostridiales bacterium]
MRFKLRMVFNMFCAFCAYRFAVSAQGAEYLPSGGGTLSLIGEDGFEKRPFRGPKAPRLSVIARRRCLTSATI